MYATFILGGNFMFLIVWKEGGEHHSTEYYGCTNTIWRGSHRGPDVFEVNGTEPRTVRETARQEARRLGINFVANLDDRPN